MSSYVSELMVAWSSPLNASFQSSADSNFTQMSALSNLKIALYGPACVHNPDQILPCHLYVPSVPLEDMTGHFFNPQRR